MGVEIAKLCRRQDLDFRVVDSKKAVGLKDEEFVLQNLYEKPLRPDLIREANVIINLLGVAMFRLLTVKNKALIYQSRVFASKSVVAQIEKYAKSKCVYIQASSVLCYKPSHRLNFEDADLDTSYWAELIKDWEAACEHLKQSLKRVVIVREGLVLGKEGFLKYLHLFKALGVLPILKIDNFKLNLIDGQDLAKIYLALVDAKFQGVLNAVMRKNYDYVNFNKTLMELYKLRPVYIPFKFINLILRGWFSDLVKSRSVGSLCDLKSELNVSLNSLRSCLLKYFKS